MPHLVLDLRGQRELPAEGRRPHDPFAFGEDAHQLAVGVHLDEAEHRGPVLVGHPVGRLDLAAGWSRAPRSGDSARRGEASSLNGRWLRSRGRQDGIERERVGHRWSLREGSEREVHVMVGDPVGAESAVRLVPAGDPVQGAEQERGGDVRDRWFGMPRSRCPPRSGRGTAPRRHPGAGRSPRGVRREMAPLGHEDAGSLRVGRDRPRHGPDQGRKPSTGSSRSPRRAAAAADRSASPPIDDRPEHVLLRRDVGVHAGAPGCRAPWRCRGRSSPRSRSRGTARSPPRRSRAVARHSRSRCHSYLTIVRIMAGSD